MNSSNVNYFDVDSLNLKFIFLWSS